MPPTLETDLKEIFAKFDQRFDRLEQRLDGMQKDLTDLKLDMAVVKTEFGAVKENVKDLKSRASAQIWALIVTIIGAIVAAVVKFEFFPNP